MKTTLIISLLMICSFVMASELSVTNHNHNQDFFAPTCVEDNLQGTFTGQTRTSSNGYLLYKYRCPSNHTWWARPDY